MKTYNDNIRYNEMWYEYNGIYFVDQILQVNSQTVSSIEVINIPTYGLVESDLSGRAEYAISNVVNMPKEGSYSIVSIDKEASHAVISLDQNLDKPAEGSFSITIISNI